MARRDQDDYTDEYDPEANIRRRLQDQMGGQVEAPSPDFSQQTQPEPTTPSPDFQQQHVPDNYQESAPIPEPEPQPTYEQQQTASPQATNPIPTNPDGSQVGSGTPWAPGSDRPSSAPPGYRWNDQFAMFEVDPNFRPTNTNTNGGDDLRSTIAKFYSDRGVQPYPTSLEYWVGKKPELDAYGQSIGRPNYFWERLAIADEFTGKPPGYVDPSLSGGGQPRSSAPGRPVQGSILGLQIPQGIWNSDFMQQIRGLILQRLQAASQPVDPNAPQIQEPVIAARDEATRQTDKERTQLAERLYAQGGLNTDQLTQNIQQSNERNATALGSLRARLIVGEFESKKSELRELMQMALAAGDAQSAREIQMQIAELNATLQREGYLNQRDIVEAQLNDRAVPR